MLPPEGHRPGHQVLEGLGPGHGAGGQGGHPGLGQDLEGRQVEQEDRGGGPAGRKGGCHPWVLGGWRRTSSKLQPGDRSSSLEEAWLLLGLLLGLLLVLLPALMLSFLLGLLIGLILGLLLTWLLGLF